MARALAMAASVASRTRRAARRKADAATDQTGDRIAAGAEVNHASGSGWRVVFRCASKRHFRRAVIGWPAIILNRAKNRGRKHAHAVRILARAEIGVRWRAWQDGTAHDPAGHDDASAST